MSYSFVNSAFGKHIFSALHNKVLIADVLTEIGILMPNCGYRSKFVSCPYQVKEPVCRLLLLVLYCSGSE